MAVTNEVTKQAASIKLQDGQTSSGALKLVSVSIGTLSSNPSNLDTQKIMNIVGLLEGIFSKVYEKTVLTVTSTLSED